MEVIRESCGWIKDNPLMIMLIWLVFIDIIFGTARAIIEHTFNSSVGKKGLILKVAMILSSIITVFIDYVVDINFLNIIPKSISDTLSLGEPGLCETVIILFCVYELTSVIKNWSKLGLPGSKKLSQLLTKFTDELQ